MIDSTKKRSLKIHSKATRAIRQIERIKKFNMLRIPNQICFFLPLFNRKHGFFIENLTNLQNLPLEDLIVIRDQIPNIETTCQSYKIIDKKQEASIRKSFSKNNTKELFHSFLYQHNTWSALNAHNEQLIDELTDDSQVGDLELRELFYLVRNYEQQRSEVKKMKHLLKYLKRDVIRLIDIRKQER